MTRRTKRELEQELESLQQTMQDLLKAVALQHGGSYTIRNSVFQVGQYMDFGHRQDGDGNMVLTVKPSRFQPEEESIPTREFSDDYCV